MAPLKSHYVSPEHWTDSQSQNLYECSVTVQRGEPPDGDVVDHHQPQTDNVNSSDTYLN